MDVLYIGPYRQNDEWGYTSKAFATLLSKQDVNLILRPIWFNADTTAKDVEHLVEYEANELTSRDVLIQHGLPAALNYNGRFKKNIAVTCVDCVLVNNEWPDHLNLFDLVVVFSEYEKKLLVDSGVTVPIFAFGFPPMVISNKKQDIDLKVSGLRFYMVGSTDEKSGTRETISAFLSEFSMLDDTVLVIATNQAKELEKEVQEIKGGLSIFEHAPYYPHVVLINNADEAVVNYLHENCEVFIDVGYNMRIGQTLLRAISFNSVPIILDTCDGLIPNYNLTVKTNLTKPVLRQRPLPFLYYGNSYMNCPNTYDLANVMRTAYNNLDEPKERALQLKNQLFSMPDKWIKECIQ